MTPPEITFREYRPEDYDACERYVREVWVHPPNFQPEALAKIAQYLYTKGAYHESNWHYVALHRGHVVGFLFGYDEKQPKPRTPWRYPITALWRFWITTKAPIKQKWRLWHAMTLHSINRASILKDRHSEVVLFLIDPIHQGDGIGTYLLQSFIKKCETSGVTKIVVETNHVGAYTFYERLGFHHLADFESPLHAYSTPDGTPCILTYTLPSQS